MDMIRQKIIKFFRDNMAILYFLIVIVFAISFLPNFLNKNNINALIRQSPVPIIRALAVAFILVLGNVDLSLGYIVGFVSVAIGMMLDSGLPVFWVILFAVLIGMIFGAFNGMLVSAMKDPSFRNFGSVRILGYPVSVIYGILFVIVVWIIFNKLRYGRALETMGLNKEAANLSGLNTRMTLLTSFVIAAGIAAFSAVLLTIRANVAQQSLGGMGDYTFEGVTACVLGGTSLAGGKVNIMGTFFAALTILMIENIITILGINRYFYQPVLGNGVQRRHYTE